MSDSKRRRGGLDRRELLRSGALAGLGLGLLPLSALAESEGAEPPRVRRRVVLGRTGLEIPDIGFGSSRLRGDEALVHHALERGITYFDTAESYTGGDAEETLGRALRGRRGEVILASKTSAGANDTRADMMAALEGSLRRLGTDHVDVYFNHAVNDPERMRNAEWAEFVAQARAQGKIRFSGMSGHGGRLVECLDVAIDDDLVDVILVAFNFGQDPAFHERFTAGLDFVARQPDLPRVLAKAKAKNVGVVAMKTLMGGRLNDLRAHERPGGTYAQAAFRWVLSRPHTDALVVTMKSPAQVDEYLGASGATAPKPGDVTLLSAYLERNGSTQCRYGCSDCAAACPAGVPISDVLRSGMYARDYGDLELAREAYASLGAGASPCLGCTATPCANACAFGVEIPTLTREAHARLAAAPAR
jgi:hypothetical protein